MNPGAFRAAPRGGSWAVVAIVAAAVSIAPAGCVASTAASAVEGPGLRSLVRAGEQAPPFTLRDLDGKAVSFHPGDGKPALIVFWSAFCPMCRELTPSVNAIAKSHGKSVRVIGVNLDGKRFSNAVASFIKEFGVPYPVVLDEIRNDLFVASDPYGVEKTPTAVLVDGKGIVRGSYAADSMRPFVSSFGRIFSDLKQAPETR